MKQYDLNEQTINCFLGYISNNILWSSKKIIEILQKEEKTALEKDIIKDLQIALSKDNISEKQSVHLENFLNEYIENFIAGLLTLFDGNIEIEECNEIYLIDGKSGKRLRVEEGLNWRFTEILLNKKADFNNK